MFLECRTQRSPYSQSEPGPSSSRRNSVLDLMGLKEGSSNRMTVYKPPSCREVTQLQPKKFTPHSSDPNSF